MSVVPRAKSILDVETSEVVYTGAAGFRQPAVLVRPRSPGRYPAIVIGQEAFGWTEHIHDVAASLAHEGYVCLIPDYYARLGSRLQFGAGPAMQEAIQRLDNSLLLGDYLQGVAYLRQLSLVRPDRIATLGFCTGGTYSMILAIHDTSLTCAVLCYVSQLVYPGLDQLKPYHPIDRAGEIRCPTLNVWGDQDAVLTPERRERLEKAFQSGRTPYEMRLYPGAGHAFLNPDLRLYHEEASRRAWPDILAFLAKHLKGR